MEATKACARAELNGGGRRGLKNGARRIELEQWVGAKVEGQQICRLPDSTSNAILLNVLLGVLTPSWIVNGLLGTAARLDMEIGGEIGISSRRGGHGPVLDLEDHFWSLQYVHYRTVVVWRKADSVLGC